MRSAAATATSPLVAATDPQIGMNPVWRTFRAMHGNAQQKYDDRLWQAAYVMHKRFGTDFELWLEKHGDGLRLVFKGPPIGEFNYAQGIPARVANHGERMPEDQPQMLCVRGTDARITKMVRVEMQHPKLPNG